MLVFTSLILQLNTELKLLSQALQDRSDMPGDVIETIKHPGEQYANPYSLGRPTVGLALFVAFTFISVPPILLFGTWLSHRQTQEAATQFDREATLRAQSIEESVREFIHLKQEVLDVTAGTLSAMPVWDLEELRPSPMHNLSQVTLLIASTLVILRVFRLFLPLILGQMDLELELK